jgi:hypothetical protein
MYILALWPMQSVPPTASRCRCREAVRHLQRVGTTSRACLSKKSQVPSINLSFEDSDRLFNKDHAALVVHSGVIQTVAPMWLLLSCDDDQIATRILLIRVETIISIEVQISKTRLLQQSLQVLLKDRT